MTEEERFRSERVAEARVMAGDLELRRRTLEWILATSKHRYTYNFTWLGRPIIQFPQDIVALQELVWSVRPEVIVETGVARGGSLVLHASLLSLLGGERLCVGVDVDIRAHNRSALEAHPFADRIALVQGSSTDPATVARVRELVRGRPALVLLDSNHTHDHVLAELRLYSPLVRKGGYVIVYDTIVEDMPDGWFPDRPWGRGNNPATAVREFLREDLRFEVDRAVEDKLLITTAPGGYLRCVADSAPALGR